MPRILDDQIDFRRFLSASSAAFAMRAAAAGAAFAMNVAVTRFLGPHEAGLFFLAQSCLVILAMVSRFGTDHLLVRFVAGFADRGQFASVNGVLAKAALIIGPLASALTVVVYLLAVPISEVIFVKPEFSDALRWASLCILPFSCFQLLSFAIQGRHQVATSVGLNAAMLPISILIVVLFAGTLGIHSAADLMKYVVGICIANSVVALFVWFRNTPWVVDHQRVGWPEITTAAYPLFLVSIFSLANLWGPQIVLAMHESADQIAMLSNSQKTASLVGFLLIAINGVAAPTYAAIHQRQRREVLQEFAGRVNGVILLTTTPVLVIVFVFAPQILAIFGPTFMPAADWLRILVVGQFINAGTGSVGYLLTMSGNERHFRNATAWAAVAGVGLSIALVPTLGGLGAAIAISVSCMVSNLLAARKVYTCLGINVLRPNVQFVFGFLKRGTV